jgi:2-oxoisovalerate ferredoxin oxidoreductase beta subunit
VPSVFFPRFERHAHAAGLKGLTTHYCAGCGHGLVQKYLSQAVEELGVQDRVVLISPVGCAVFMYYYFDVGNSQAAHGRAPAVAIGHKLANPDSTVVAYQGDGDLASIGLAEILQACQLGYPLSFIFVNNAVFGMTGGQMAPTTLTNQKTSTTPKGRGRMEGAPLRMAELVAQIDGPVYVERVALFDNKQRHRAALAIKKALRLQIENRGLGFVEVLAECPVHTRCTPTQAEEWVRDQMVPVFPLGVKKDVTVEPWFDPGRPTHDPDAVAAAVGATADAAPRCGARFPAHLDRRDVALKFAGAGGDGAQTIALLTTKAAIHEGFDATCIPSYGPESRGGTSYADVHIAPTEVLSPAAPSPHVLVVFNGESLDTFGPGVRPGGTILYDCAVIPEPPVLEHVRLIGIPFTRIALELGASRGKNMVALGALQAATRLFPEGAFLAALREALRQDAALLTMNETAFAAGVRAVHEEVGT